MGGRLRDCYAARVSKVELPEMRPTTEERLNGARQPAGESRGPVSPWLWPALLSLGVFGVWGLQSKIVSERISPEMNQILSTPGLLVVALLLRQKHGGTSQLRRAERMIGIGCAFLTGVLGTIGNMTFYEALSEGKAAIVVPLTTLYPMVTLVLAALLLKETIKARQWAGILLAVTAILILGG